MFKTLKISRKEHNNFIKLSGDFNPLHISKQYAVEYGFEDLMVHGVHLFLKGLELVKKKIIFLKKAKIDFFNPIYLGPKIFAEINEENECIQIKLMQNLKKCLIIYLSLSKSKTFKKEEIKNFKLFNKKKPEVHSPNEQNYSGTLYHYIDPKKLSDMWTDLTKIFGCCRLHGIISLTTIVGMYYPGEKSLLKSINISFSEKCKKLKFQKVKMDKRFGLTQIKVNGMGVEADVQAFFRKQIDFRIPSSHIEKLNSRDNFSNQVSLVIGGSQGLGSALAQTLSFGGAEVTATFKNNYFFAKKIFDHLQGYDRKIKFKKLNIENKYEFRKILREKKYNSIYICATPKIFSRTDEIFSIDILNTFLMYYVNCMIEILKFYKNQKKIAIFVPSSITTKKPVIGLEEYITAKFCLELLSNKINKISTNFKVFSPRIDRLLTNQTRTFNQVKNKNIFQLSHKFCAMVSEYLTNEN